MFEYTDIKTAPAALGPYSQAVMAGKTLYASGAIGIDPETGKFAGEDVKSQCEQACKNVGEILKANGMTYDNVVKTTCYILDMAEFKVFSSYKIRESSLHHSSSFASYTSQRKISRIGAATAP